MQTALRFYKPTFSIHPAKRERFILIFKTLGLFEGDFIVAIADADFILILRGTEYRGWVSVEMRAAPDWRAALREAGERMRPAWL